MLRTIKFLYSALFLAVAVCFAASASFFALSGRDWIEGVDGPRHVVVGTAYLPVLGKFPTFEVRTDSRRVELVCDPVIRSSVCLRQLYWRLGVNGGDIVKVEYVPLKCLPLGYCNVISSVTKNGKVLISDADSRMRIMSSRADEAAGRFWRVFFCIIMSLVSTFALIRVLRAK